MGRRVKPRARRTVRKRASRASQHVSRRVFYLQEPIGTSTTASTILRQDVFGGQLSGFGEFAQNWHRYRIVKLLAILRPSRGLESSTFDVETAGNAAVSFVDQFNEYVGTSFSGALNMQYARRHSTKIIRRMIKPIVRQDEVGQPGSVPYQVLRSPWISTTSVTVPHYGFTVQIPANVVGGVVADPAMAYTNEMWVTIEFTGKKNPVVT